VAILESCPEAIAVISPDGSIAFWNRRAEEVFGWTREETVGKHFTLLVPESSREELAERMREATRWRRHTPRAIADVIVEGRDGTKFPVQVHYSSLRDGDLRYVTAVVRRSNTALTGEIDALTLFLRKMFESSPDPIFCTSTNGTVLTWNPAAERLFGFTADEMIGHSVMRTVPDDALAETQSMLTRALAGEQITTGRIVRQRKDGTLVLLEAGVWPVYDRSGAVLGVACVVHDLTDRVQLEAQLDDAHRIGAIGRLAATVAHEFNNVLMAIAPFVEIVKRAAPGDPAIANAARHINTALLRGRNITAEVLRFGRPSSLNLTTFDAAAWLRRVGVELRSLIPDRIAFGVTTPDEALPITADDHQLTQVMTNLVVNARDAIGRRSGEIRVRLSAIPDLDEVEITVQDSGPGIPPETVGRLFEPLFTTKPNGTGLGLPVSQQIVLRHGGQISVSSSPSGTTFRVTLPVAAVESPP
jgi:PAS domain S-box-containing protein